MKQETTSDAAYYFHEGSASYAYTFLGCHLLSSDAEKYRYVFRTWAPSARAVCLVSDRTGWQDGLPLKRVTDKGVWEVEYEADESLEGMPYKFRIYSDGKVRDKGDPYAFASKGMSDGASLVTHPSDFMWADEGWLAHRRKTVSKKEGIFYAAPLNIYELHAGSFDRKEDGGYLSYHELADSLSSYVKYMGYTHVELMPIAEHPFDGSWGYQVGAFYAPTSRFGTPDGFRYFVNTLHKAGVGVILDWVPAHFPKDEWGLYEFDGQPLYEYQGWDRMESRSWGTRFFDLGREEIQSFLISNALYFMREFHVDGLRVDAVASMLYLDYDRMPWEWVPNVYGDNKNLEAIAFLRKLNDTVDREFPDVLMIAEESTAFGGITHSTAEGGLGFDLKWNMGFANDFFDYLAKEPIYRRYHHTALNFPILYAFGENYLLPISHDEVVHGKRSLIGKIAGSYEDKFATLRACMMFFMSFPGKKMLFMGTEYAAFSEWWEERPLEWFMLAHERHASFRTFLRELNHFYLSESALYERDFTLDGFSWLLADEADKNLVAYRRYAADGHFLIVLVSFSGAEQTATFEIEDGSYTVAFDTGRGRGGERYRTDAEGRLNIDLAPFEALYLRAENEEMFLIN